MCKVYKAKDEEFKEEVFRSEEYGFVPRYQEDVQSDRLSDQA